MLSKDRQIENLSANLNDALKRERAYRAERDRLRGALRRYIAALDQLDLNGKSMSLQQISSQLERILGPDTGTHVSLDEWMKAAAIYEAKLAGLRADLEQHITTLDATPNFTRAYRDIAADIRHILDRTANIHQE